MSARIRFTKMQGLGNDFVVIDGISQRIDLSPSQIVRLADRHFGVGCDQVLLVEKSSRPGVDFRYRIFNADGGEVEQCGNGARCFVHFVRDRGLTAKRKIRVETRGGIIEPALEPDGRVCVDMGVPRFEPEAIPFEPEAPSGVGRDVPVVQQIDVAGAAVTISALSMGNPHAVQVVADVDLAPVASQGPMLEHHPRFPRGVNAGYMQIVDRANIRLRVWERGAGETLACGTGACAAVVAGVDLAPVAIQGPMLEHHPRF
ncbi:MAG TPA: diaminopimelate epimerase, partial [Casimicrobiaceae bacterium]|nr:diaminopimelate epimerase [Casimicrobiaceae bacterium]